jgi:hypothetical protein
MLAVFTQDVGVARSDVQDGWLKTKDLAECKRGLPWSLISVYMAVLREVESWLIVASCHE